jgi:hypothetical protein
MFTDFFTTDQEDMASTATSSACKRKEKKRRSLTGSNLSGDTSISSHAGAVRRVERTNRIHSSEQASYTTLYFRCRAFDFTTEEQKAFDRELKIAWSADIASRVNVGGEGRERFCLADVYRAARGFHFCNLVRGKNRTLLRSPRGQDQQWSTFVQTDEPGSFGEVRAIVDVFGMTWCLVRWFTSEYRGSVPKELASSIMAQARSDGANVEDARNLAIKKLQSPREGPGGKLLDHFYKYQRTANFSLLHVSQILSTVHMVPCFDTDGFFWHNTRALGTALQAYHITQDDDISRNDQ